MNITVKKTVLQATVQQHYKNHVEEHVLQMLGWQEKMAEHNTKMQEWAKDGGTKHRPNEPTKPQNFKKDYERWIKMIDVHIGETMDLDEEDFDTLIMDRYRWKSQFHTNSVLYNGSLAQIDDNE